MIHARYTVIQTTPTFVLIRDLGPWDTFSSVTNDAEYVVNELLNVRQRLQTTQRLLYYDSSGLLGELKHDGQKFTGFAAVVDAPLCQRCGGTGEVLAPEQMASCPKCKPLFNKPPDLPTIRAWARDCACDNGITLAWRQDFEALAEACERLMRRYEHATVREEPPA